MMVAARYDNGQWHRAQIIELVDYHRVQLVYVDYGTKCIVHLSNVRLLDKEFVGLPQLAIKAKLGGLVIFNLYNLVWLIFFSRIFLHCLVPR